MKIAENRVVTIHYTLTDDSGQTLDSSAGSDPLSYVHGSRGLIPGLERELAGCEVGDALQVSIQPEDAYGQPDPELVQQIPLDALAHIDELQVGMQLQSQNQAGQTQVVVVESIDDTHATLNANHVLAGQVLHFEVTVEDVREATADELSSGRPV